jgi:hypothetical protein
MKRFAMIVLAAVTLIGGIGVANAQMHGSHGGGAMSGGGHGGGSWQGGGSWHGGNNWNGGNWHGGHTRFVIGVGFGAPFWGWGWWPGYYYPGYYPAYPAYPYSYQPYSYDTYPSGTYIEQNAPAPNPARSDYSYYCPDPAGYYPEVRACAKGWLRVVPQNAPGPAGPTSY